MSGKMLLKDSTLSLKIDQQTLGTQPKILTAKQRTVDQKDRTCRATEVRFDS